MKKLLTLPTFWGSVALVAMWLFPLEIDAFLRWVSGVDDASVALTGLFPVSVLLGIVVVVIMRVVPCGRKDAGDAGDAGCVHDKDAGDAGCVHDKDELPRLIMLKAFPFGLIIGAVQHYRHCARLSKEYAAKRAAQREEAEKRGE